VGRGQMCPREVLLVMGFVDEIQWKPFIMITLGPALFDNNNRLITLSGGYKNLHDLTQFIVTIFYMYKKQSLLKNYVVLRVVCLHLVVPE
jgi:hypothetical protein